MTDSIPRRLLPALVAAVLTLAGCGAKEEEAAVAAPEAATEAPAEAAETASTTEESTTDTLVIQALDVEETLAASDKAAQNKNWQTATDNLLKLQMTGSLKTDAESWKYNNRMTLLQDQLIQAAESGDPKAKAAMDLLRRSRQVR